jgi:hypothetical protein
MVYDFHTYTPLSLSGVACPDILFKASGYEKTDEHRNKYRFPIEHKIFNNRLITKKKYRRTFGGFIFI